MRNSARLLVHSFLILFILTAVPGAFAYDVNYNFSNYSFESGTAYWDINATVDLNSGGGSYNGTYAGAGVRLANASERTHTLDFNMGYSSASGIAGSYRGGLRLANNNYSPNGGDKIYFDVNFYYTDNYYASGSDHIQFSVFWKALDGSYYAIQNNSCVLTTPFKANWNDTQDDGAQNIWAKDYNSTGGVGGVWWIAPKNNSWVKKVVNIPACISTTGGGRNTAYPVYFDFHIRQGCSGSCGVIKENVKAALDNFVYQRKYYTQLENYITEPTEPVSIDDNSLIKIKVSDLNGSQYYQDANVRFSFNGAPFTNLPYSSFYESYVYWTGSLSVGDYNYAVDSNHSGDFLTDYDQGTLQVRRQEYQYLTFTPILNSDNWEYGSILITPDDELGEIIFRVDSNSGATEVPLFKIKNSLNDGRQYFIYTSEDGENWAFNDSLTYGATIDDPIQKIWNENEEIYIHSFDDTLIAGETKYYKLVYQSPYNSWNSIGGSPEWFKNLQPSVNDTNNASWDIYSVSSYSNIYSYYTEPIPDTYIDFPDVYELQFTAWSDVNNATVIQVGQITDGVESLTNITLSSIPTRYSITINPAGYNSLALIKTDVASPYQVSIMDYALVARAYFVKRLTILKSSGEFLDSILLNGYSKQYLQEGNPYNLSTEAYDRNGDLRELTLNAYFDTNAAANRVKQQIFEVATDDTATQENSLFFNQDFDPVIDLSGTAFNPADPRNIIIEAKLLDRNNNVVAVQSLPVKFLQYPYFPDDVKLDYYPTEKRKGKNPDGILTVEINRPETLLGFDIRIYSDTNTISSPNYQAKVYNGLDFACYSQFCEFQLKIEDWLYEDVNKTTVTIFALLNTETLDQNNYLTRVDRSFYATPIEFNIAEIFEVMERTDHTYNNAEEIPLVLILRDSEATDLRGKLNVYLTLGNCDGNVTPNCVEQTTKYKPTGSMYSQSVQVTYYLFRHYYTLDDGTALPDGNYIRFRATVTDATGARTGITPVLAHKCYNDILDSNKFFQTGFLGDIEEALRQLAGGTKNALFGCTTPQNLLVTTTQNSDQERYLQINAARTAQDPNNFFWACKAPDQNNVYSSSLKKDLDCIIAYRVSEKPIDSFRIRIGNAYSDYRKTGEAKQYLEFNVPYEIVANSDIMLLASQLKPDQDTSINTIGDLFYYGLNHKINDPYSVEHNTVDGIRAFFKNGIISNVGGDFNYEQALSPNLVTGAMLISFKGLNVINANDYRTQLGLMDEDDYTASDLTNFISLLNESDILYSAKPAKVSIVVSDLAIPYNVTDAEGSLVINESPTDITINSENVDENIQVRYKDIPVKLWFTLNETMFYNNMSQNQALSFNISIYDTIKRTGWESIKKLVDDLKEDPVAATLDFVISNILIIWIFLALLIGISILYSNFRRGGGGVALSTTHHHHYNAPQRRAW